MKESFISDEQDAAPGFLEQAAALLRRGETVEAVTLLRRAIRAVGIFDAEDRPNCEYGDALLEVLPPRARAVALHKFSEMHRTGKVLGLTQDEAGEFAAGVLKSMGMLELPVSTW